MGGGGALRRSEEAGFVEGSKPTRVAMLGPGGTAPSRFQGRRPDGGPGGAAPRKFPLFQVCVNFRPGAHL